MSCGKIWDLIDFSSYYSSHSVSSSPLLLPSISSRINPQPYPSVPYYDCHRLLFSPPPPCLSPPHIHPFTHPVNVLLYAYLEEITEVEASTCLLSLVPPERKTSRERSQCQTSSTTMFLILGHLLRVTSLPSIKGYQAAQGGDPLASHSSYYVISHWI